MTDKIIQHSRRNKDKIMAETTTKKDTVLRALTDNSPEPMTAPMLVEYTDLDIDAVRGALATLKAAGQAVTVKRGHYVAVSAPEKVAAPKRATAAKAKTNGGPKMEFKVIAIDVDGAIVLKNSEGVWKAEQVF